MSIANSKSNHVGAQAYMLNTRSGEENTGFYSYLACVCEYINLEFVRVAVIYRVNQAENGIHIRVAASQECVSTYSTRRRTGHLLGNRRRPERKNQDAEG